MQSLAASPKGLLLRAVRPPLSARLALAALGAAWVVGAGVPSIVALGLGAALGLALGAPAWANGLGQRLLKVGVIGLGAGLDLEFVLRAGLDGLGTTALTLAMTLSLGAWLTRRTGVGADVGTLITVGTAICGGSAIAAAAPALRARGGDVGVALGVVFALNAAALVVFPMVGRAAGLDPLEFGRWCALAIHDTSSVVGAAATFGPDALELATVTKLARALWIVPVVFALGWLRARRHGAGEGGPTKFPLFILGFLGAAALVTLAPTLAPVGEQVAAAARRVLLLALFALGLGTSAATLRGVGLRPLALGLALWVIVSAGSLALVALA
ncbi:MAG: putative sulfate exporter family transporter [Planctomycetota bacterium]